MQNVLCGADRILSDPNRLRILRTRRVALLANPTSVTADFEHLIDALIAKNVSLIRLFGPEHGIRGEAQDMISVKNNIDPISKIKTISLYGEKFEQLIPSKEDLKDIDLMIVDLQDIGARYYTYIYTAMFVVEACTKAGIEVWVLDLPNPIANPVEGPTVYKKVTSFVGMLPLPNRHSLTIGEVLHFARLKGRKLEFELITVKNWNRSLYADQHNAPWIMPSPNMPTLDTAIVYPGMCLIEGTNLSEGRGTTRPFEIVGAPYINANYWREELRKLHLPGVRFRLTSFRPTFQKWANQICQGLQIHITDRQVYNSFKVGVALIWTAASCFKAFQWRKKAYEFVNLIPAIDLLFGSDKPRISIENGTSFEQLMTTLHTSNELLEAINAAKHHSYQ